MHGGSPPTPPPLTLEELLRRDLVRPVFQPIVDLETRAVHGFEALARGPRGSPWESADGLFAAARAQGLVVELDAACQRAAVSAAQTRALETPLTVFMNVEPETLGTIALPRFAPAMRTMVELTERTLTNRLVELLPAVQRARSQGWGIALDDVGTDTRSLALMPLLRPDVIKLDLRLIQAQPTPEIAAIVGAVGAQSERTGATVLAEGIETEEQAFYAQSLGASLGQGFLFGSPATELPPAHRTRIPLPILRAPQLDPGLTPFELASSRHSVRRGSLPLLDAISRELELQAARLRNTSLLISTFPDAQRFAAHKSAVYEQLANALAFTAALAVGMPPQAAPGLLGVQIDADDPLGGTWNVVVLGAHFAAMLAAQQRPQQTSHDTPDFDFVVSYDRHLIVECAQALALRIALSGGGERAN